MNKKGPFDSLLPNWEARAKELTGVDPIGDDWKEYERKIKIVARHCPDLVCIHNAMGMLEIGFAWYKHNTEVEQMEQWYALKAWNLMDRYHLAWGAGVFGLDRPELYMLYEESDILAEMDYVKEAIIEMDKNKPV